MLYISLTVIFIVLAVAKMLKDDDDEDHGHEYVKNYIYKENLEDSAESDSNEYDSKPWITYTGNMKKFMDKASKAQCKLDDLVNEVSYSQSKAEDSDSDNLSDKNSQRKDDEDSDASPGVDTRKSRKTLWSAAEVKELLHEHSKVKEKGITRNIWETITLNLNNKG